MNVFENKINLITSTIVAFFSAIFGDFWFLFVFLLGLNFIDYITGILKARYLKIESSSKAFRGFAKTLYTWVLIAISFGVSSIFVQIGEFYGINLNIMSCIGWFMLTHCIVNEIRSILENIIQMDKGDLIPTWLIKGLEVAQNLVDKKANNIIDKLDSEDSNTKKESEDKDNEQD